MAMDLNFTTEEEEFRLMAREWIDQNLPDAFRHGQTRSIRAERDTWYKRLAEKGWLCQSWPEEYGGTGWNLAKQFIFSDEASMQGAPPNNMGVTMIGPMLIEMGTQAQKDRYLPTITAAEEMWCQGYSEPNAGSDLASLALSARLEDDHYILNGQKIWTSYADESDIIFILVRTDTTTEKRQQGISFLVAPMDTPGIEIRPIKQITDEAHFFETFFTDAKVPKENLIGTENEGWTVGKRVLAHERVSTGAAGQYRTSLQKLRNLAEETGAAKDPIIRQKLAQLYMDFDALKSLGFRGLTQLFHGELPGPESSIMKVYGTELFQRISDLALEIQGPAGILWDDESLQDLEQGWPKTAVGSRAYSIFSGTNEIQRNIISERVLGLPR